MNKKKGSTTSSILTRWKAMKFFAGDEYCRLDMIGTFLILTFLFFTCAHMDLRVTGNRSFNMFVSIRDFYKVSYEQSQAYFANYLPSTFGAYAIWNLPLYLTGHIPVTAGDNSIINVLWYKLLPVILYVITSQIMYAIGMQMGFGEKKSRLLKYAFLIFPVGVFSQFIFSQYDIFTVFFIVLGFYFYIKGDMWKFAAMFGLATTFKYQAALYFLVFLVLKEKKIRNMIQYGIVMILPFAIEVLPYWKDPYFQRNVFGFVMLRTLTTTTSIGFFGGFNIMAAAAGFFLFWSYLKKTESREEFLSWAVFFSVGMSFAYFGFSSWNPQWLLMLVPFVVLGIFVNTHANALMMLSNVLILSLYIYTSKTMVGESVVFSGVLKYLLRDGEMALRMWDIYPFHNEGILLGAIWGCLLCYAVFAHPKHHTRLGSSIPKGLIWQMRSAFLVCFAAFMIPLLLCVADNRKGGVVYINGTTSDYDENNYIGVNSESTVSQEIIADGNIIRKFMVCAKVGNEQPISTVHVSLIEKERGTVVYTTEKEAFDFTTNGSYYNILNDRVSVEEGKTYTLELTSDSDPGQGLYLYCENIGEETEILQEGAECEVPRRLKMKVTGYQ